MRIITIGLTKISCEKQKPANKFSLNNHIEFTNVEKENVDFLVQDQAIKVSFRYTLSYTNENGKNDKKAKEDKLGEIIFEGFLILSLAKEEAKEFEKAWKKKQIPENNILPLYNFILRKCTIKAIPLQDELGLPPPYFNFPRLSKKEN